MAGTHFLFRLFYSESIKTRSYPLCRTSAKTGRPILISFEKILMN